MPWRPVATKDIGKPHAFLFRDAHICEKAVHTANLGVGQHSMSADLSTQEGVILPQIERKTDLTTAGVIHGQWSCVGVLRHLPQGNVDAFKGFSKSTFGTICITMS